MSTSSKSGSFSKQARFTGSIRGIQSTPLNIQGMKNEGAHAPFYLSHENWSQRRTKSAAMSKTPRTSHFVPPSRTEEQAAAPGPGDGWENISTLLDKKVPARYGFMGTGRRDTGFYLAKNVKDPTPAPGHYESSHERSHHSSHQRMSKQKRDTTAQLISSSPSPGPGAYHSDPANMRNSIRSSRSETSRCSFGESQRNMWLSRSPREHDFRPSSRTSIRSTLGQSNVRFSHRLEDLAKPRYTSLSARERRAAANELAPRVFPTYNRRESSQEDNRSKESIEVTPKEVKMEVPTLPTQVTQQTVEEIPQVVYSREIKEPEVVSQSSQSSAWNATFGPSSVKDSGASTLFVPPNAQTFIRPVLQAPRISPLTGLYRPPA